MLDKRTRGTHESSPLPGTSCTAWRVRAEGSDASLDAEEVANLEALGYVGD